MNDMDLHIRWDGIERRAEWRGLHDPVRSRFQVAAGLCPEIVIVLGRFLGEDDRFQNFVGGNPTAVDEMLAEARDLLQRMSPP